MSWHDPITGKQLQIIKALKQQLRYSMLASDESLNRAQARDEINALYRERWRVKRRSS